VAKQGWITAIPGEVIDQSVIEGLLAVDRRRYTCKSFLYDPMYARGLTQRMEDDARYPARRSSPRRSCTLRGHGSTSG